MNEIEQARCQASEALTALFRDHHAGEPPEATDHRVDDVLEALATFSATVVHQEIQQRLHDGLLPVDAADVAADRKPPPG
jgi:hypothetical protein